MSGRDSVTEAPAASGQQQSSGITIATGILLLILGLFAVNAPLITGVSLALMVGVALIVGGVGQLFHAIGSGEGVLAIVVAILTTAIGGYMVSRPGAGLGALTLFLALYLIVSGFVEAIISLSRGPGWGFVLTNSILSMVLGALIWFQFPLSGVWAIGVLVGVRLLFSGVTLLALGFRSRRAS